MTHIADPRQDALQAWKDHTDRQVFEHQLIDRKTSWSLTTHGILFAAYGLTLGAKEPPDAHQFQSTVAWSGLAVAVVTLLGVGFVVLSKWRTFLLYEKHFGSMRSRPDLPGIKPLRWGAGPFNTLGSLLPDICVPIVFLIAWSVLING
jgi:hypothetical protein